MAFGGRFFSFPRDGSFLRRRGQKGQVDGTVGLTLQVDHAAVDGDLGNGQGIGRKIVGAALYADPVDPDRRVRRVGKPDLDSRKAHDDVVHPDLGFSVAGFSLSLQIDLDGADAGFERRCAARILVVQRKARSDQTPPGGSSRVSQRRRTPVVPRRPALWRP